MVALQESRSPSDSISVRQRRKRVRLFVREVRSLEMMAGSGECGRDPMLRGDLKNNLIWAF